MKKLKVIGLLVLSAVMLTGCLDAMPDLTDEESELVAEYAAGLLLKYSPNYDYMLVSDDELAAALEEEAVSEAEETPTQEQTETAREEPESEESKETAPQEETEAPPSETQTQQAEQAGNAFLDEDTDLAMELGFDEEITLRYQSFEIYDSYPQNSAGFSGIEAGEGKKLLILHFDLENMTDEEIDCELFDYMLKVRITINQSVSVSTADASMLPNDMTTYVGSIDAGAREDVVAIAEIADMTDSDIKSLTFQVSSQNGSCSIKIR